MRRLHIGRRGIARRLALGLPLGQKAGQPGQPIDLTCLARHHVRQVLDRADQMRDPFLQRFDPVHGRLP